MNTFNKQKTILAIFISILLIAVSVAVIKSISVVVLESSIKVNGLYGIEIPFTDIDEVKEIDSIPFWGIKTNGINLGFINIGMFTYQELGKVRLFEIKKEKPYILIIGKNKKIVLGLGKETNKEIFRKLVEKVNMNSSGDVQ